MTQRQLDWLRKCLLDALVEQFMGLIKPLQKQTEVNISCIQSLRDRVERLERQMAAMQEKHEQDMNILLRDALTKGDPVNNPFHSIFTR
jgi:hypothetical protein